MNDLTLLCGIPVHDVTLEETIDRVTDMVAVGRRSGRSHQVATVNVDFLVHALDDAYLRDVLQHVDLAVPDGMPLVWASRLLDAPLRERVAGADLVPSLAARGARDGFSLYLFGGAGAVAEEAAALLQARHPSLRVRGHGGPVFAFPQDMDPQVLDDIRDFQPDVLCVALGHPKQDHWIDRYRDALGVPVMIGVGGSLDFLVGEQRRAPEWMQRTGTEWLHRAWQEPGRLGKRYATDLGRFGPAVLREVSLARRRPVLDALATLERRGSVTVVEPRGRIRPEDPALCWTDKEWRAVAPGHRVVVDLRHRDTLHRSEVQTLVALAKRLGHHGAELELESVRPPVARTLRRLHVDHFFLHPARTARSGRPRAHHPAPGVLERADRELTDGLHSPEQERSLHA